MDSETMINSMGGSIKENMYKGALGPPRKSLEKASLQLVIFHKSQLSLLLRWCRTLGSSLSQIQRNRHSMSYAQACT